MAGLERVSKACEQSMARHRERSAAIHLHIVPEGEEQE
jgi:hypothetical protein